MLAACLLKKPASCGFFLFSVINVGFHNCDV
jgi:hypothetical protein